MSGELRVRCADGGTLPAEDLREALVTLARETAELEALESKPPTPALRTEHRTATARTAEAAREVVRLARAAGVIP
ncbi:MAG: hypothetical protein ABII82_13370 [Verrucomicrobiota bacterium]